LEGERRGGEGTYASATPIITGMSEINFMRLLDTPNIDADNAIVNIGVEALTT
jgi:hypothetical protein